MYCGVIFTKFEMKCCLILPPYIQFSWILLPFLLSIQLSCCLAEIQSFCQTLKDLMVMSELVLLI